MKEVNATHTMCSLYMYIVEAIYNFGQTEPSVRTFENPAQVLGFAVEISDKFENSEIKHIFKYENQSLVPYEVIYDKRLLLCKIK